MAPCTGGIGYDIPRDGCAVGMGERGELPIRLVKSGLRCSSGPGMDVDEIGHGPGTEGVLVGGGCTAGDSARGLGEP